MKLVNALRQLLVAPSLLLAWAAFQSSDSDFTSKCQNLRKCQHFDTTASAVICVR